jgi:hypothetical protein
MTFSGLRFRFTGRAQAVALDRSWRRELERLSRDADPDSQAALDRLLCRRGHVLATVRSSNLTTTEGLNHAGAAVLPNGSWYILAKGAGTPVIGDTAASHASWPELTTYSQSARPGLTLGAFSGGVANNAAAVAIFTTPAGGLTFHGWGIINAPTKGGTTGKLIAVANHASPQALGAAVALRQTITVTVT